MKSNLDWTAIDKWLTGEAFVDSRLDEFLYQICERIGPRWAGTAGDVAAGSYIVERFEEFGLTNPRSEDFELKAWDYSKCEGTVVDEDLAITDPSGNVRPNFAIRPQPRRFAGVPSAFEVTDDEVTATWTHDPSLGDTVVFVPASAWWGVGSVDVAAPASLSCGYDAGSMLVTCSGTSAVEVTIDVTPG